MKEINKNYGEYLDYCKQNNMIPTDEGYKQWFSQNKTIIITKPSK